MNRQWDAHYEVHQVYLSDKDKDLSSQTVTNFSVTLPNDLKNVVAIRPLMSSFYDNTTDIAQIEIGGTQLPVRISTGQGLFLYLNGYDNIHTAKSKNVPIFSRVQADDNYPIIRDFWMDPFTYILNPKEHRLRKFDVKIYDSNYAEYVPDLPANASFNILLAVYCEVNNNNTDSI